MYSSNACMCKIFGVTTFILEHSLNSWSFFFRNSFPRFLRDIQNSWLDFGSLFVLFCVKMIPHCFGNVEVPAVGRPIQDWKCFILVFLSKCAFAALAVSGQDIKRVFFKIGKTASPSLSSETLFFPLLLFSFIVSLCPPFMQRELSVRYADTYFHFCDFGRLIVIGNFIFKLCPLCLPHCAPSALSENSLPPQNRFSLIVLSD